MSTNNGNQVRNLNNKYESSNYSGVSMVNIEDRVSSQKRSSSVFRVYENLTI